MNYSEYVLQQLKENPLVRNLFNKLNKEVEAQFSKHSVKGILKTICIGGEGFYTEIHDGEKVHFINMKAKNLNDFITPVTIDLPTGRRIRPMPRRKI